LTFTVVGAGPTGVAIAEFARRTLSQDFRRIDPRSAPILLLDGAQRILPTFPEDLSRSALAKWRVWATDRILRAFSAWPKTL